MPVQLQSHSGDEGDEARIEIIPLIDIMFFLLAAFMLVSLSMTHMRRVQVNLATASTSVAQTESPPVVIAVDANGVPTWEGELMSLSEIRDRLASMPADQRTRVIIAADSDTRHHQVLAVMNAAREAGVEDVSFETGH